jgi:hypothetical protein
MTQLNNGPISSNDLMQRLAQAKKVMNKVDGGNFERGHVNESMLLSDPEEYIQNSNVSIPATKNVAAPSSISKIQNSKLPDNIKKAMIENPIEQMPQISLSETLDMDFIKGAKRLMESEGVSTNKQTSKQTTSKPFQQTSNIDMNSIAVIIENTVRKVMDEKLNQILSAQQTQSINENLVLKVGDSIFKGKITGVNKSK